jgi:hypothetical protein
VTIPALLYVLNVRKVRTLPTPMVNTTDGFIGDRIGVVSHEFIRISLCLRMINCSVFFQTKVTIDILDLQVPQAACDVILCVIWTPRQ